MLGSIALSAAIDTIMVLSEKNNGYKLHIKGKDVLKDVIDLEFNQVAGYWSVQDNISSIDTTPERREILGLLSESGEMMRTGEIAAALNKKNSNISNILSKMLKDGIVTNPRTGYYALPNNDKSNISNENSITDESSENDESGES